MAENFKRIVITGGSPEERGNAVRQAADICREAGYVVFREPSALGTLSGSGITPETCGTATDFARVLLSLDSGITSAFTLAAREAPNEKLIIVCSGGTMDAAALLDDTAWQQLLRETGANEVELRDAPDAVFCLNTQAGDTMQPSTQQLLHRWAGHPHLRSKPSEEQLTREIRAFLGEPEPLEIERKYLIEYPSMAWLNEQNACVPVEIEQVYLTTQDGEDIRVRKRGSNGSWVYFETIKRGGAGIQRTEIERRITAQEYQRAIQEASGAAYTISKTRYCMPYDDQYLEIDVYPFWSSRAVLEVELASPDDPVHIPPEIHVIEEVTGDPDYTNYALARAQTDGRQHS